MADEETKIAEAIRDFTGTPTNLETAIADLMAQAIDSVLKELGVSPGDPHDVQRQMEEREIIINEINSEVAPQLCGYYFYQHLVPMAFITWPYLNKEGKLMVQIQKFKGGDLIADVKGVDIIH
jgi:hypothetical protein